MLTLSSGTLAGAVLGLVCLAAGPLSNDTTGATDKLEERLDSLRTEYKQAERSARDAMRKADTPQAQAEASRINPWDGFSERFNELAFEAEGTEVAAGAWATIFLGEFDHGGREQSWEAFNILVNDHPDSLELVPVVSRTQYESAENKQLVEGLHQLRETSEAREVQAGSLFSLARLLESGEKSREEAFGYYRQIVADFADVESDRGKTLGARATGALFEAEHLQVGMSVPDIAATDETNTAFRLSDYEGKVVLVDFWGFW